MNGIPGLVYRTSWITEDTERALLAFLDSQHWDTTLKRRTQHYGYLYDYKARTVTDEAYLGPLPVEFEYFADKLCPLFDGVVPDQVIANEYRSGQGIAPHVDCTPCFGPIVASLTMGGGCMMDFTAKGLSYSCYLEPRSLVILSGISRTHWYHGIKAVTEDTVNGVVIPRERRVSLTFRTVIKKA